MVHIAHAMQYVQIQTIGYSGSEFHNYLMLELGNIIRLKALTDHLGRGSRVGSFDPY
jgi:hypothetical protein